MPASQWATIFKPVDRKGKPLMPEELPLVIATMHQRPAHSSFWIEGMDQRVRKLEVTAFPLVSQDEQFLGAIAFFWEVEE
jgi:hypothetical protein